MRHPNRRGNVAIWLPNILTYLRIAAVPLVVGLLIYGGEVNRWIALGIFIAAAITDFFDGYLARIWQQQSSLGRMLDPIADKLLIASVLLAVTYAGQIAGLHIWAAVIILVPRNTGVGLCGSFWPSFAYQCQ
jgi:cardiolipin synthase